MARFILAKPVNLTIVFATVDGFAVILSTDEHEQDDVRDEAFLAQATSIPKRLREQRATTPEAKSNATLQAAVLFATGFVARRLPAHYG
jgi:hypothetical protein